VRALLDRGLVARVRRLGEMLDAALHSALGQHPHVGDIRGRGLFRGIELVEDRETKASFDPKEKIAAKLKKAAMEAGLICYPMSGTIDGQRGDHILLAPPFIMTEDQIDELTEKVAATVRAVLG
jgi:adenosylmethionine-8-amino-7-oxononanoate aminotransferase